MTHPCCRCHRSLPTSRFYVGEGYRKSRRNRGVSPYCKTCFKLRRYGLSAREYLRLLTSQRGRCRCCHKSANLEIDHDHHTGKVRGLVCGTCNRGLGYFEKYRGLYEAYLGLA